MAWEQRGTNSYYYRKRWQDGRVVSEYLGTGALAQLLVALEEARRAKEETERLDERRRRAQAAIGRRVLAEPVAQLRALTRAVLLVNGYHQHKGQWRKAVMGQDIVEHAQTGTALNPGADAAEEQRGYDALSAALRIKAEPTGKRGVVTPADEAQAEQARRAAVRQVLRDYPCLWPRLRNLLSNAEHALIDAIGCNRESAMGQVMIKSLQSLRDGLGYQDAPLLEQLLIEHIVLAWLDMDIVQQYYAGNAMKQHALNSGAYWDRRMNGAQLRYLRAVEALARVRRLAQPTPLQVNIGGQQVNVVGVS